MKQTTPDNQSTACACGSLFPIHPPGYSGASGYAVLPSGERICYACADKRQIAELKDRTKPFCAYVAYSDTRLVITTWTGGHLMNITSARPCNLTRYSHAHGKSCLSIHAVDVHGGHWAGRGSEGIAIKLRPVKG